MIEGRTLFTMSKEELRQVLSAAEEQLQKQLIAVRWTRADIRRIYRLLDMNFKGEGPHE